MPLDPVAAYAALRARDPRFDGVFFVGVTTTGIYCRPVCPARTPGADRCRFFERAFEAERAGFRACFRCRPELAPGAANVDAMSRLAVAANEAIRAGALDDLSVDELATSLRVSSRHLRRALTDELGAGPLELAEARRVAIAKQLLQDTTLSKIDIAFAAGFGSVRRFHAVMRERLGDVPRRAKPGDRDTFSLRLDARPPFAATEILEFLGARALPGVEQVAGDVYRRAVRIREAIGWVEVRVDRARPRLHVTASTSLSPVVVPLVARLRATFDLDAHPAAIRDHLEKDPRLAPLVRARPGLRVPGAFDPFEVAVRTVLGQQITVRAASTLAARLIHRFGEPLATGFAGLDRIFPKPAALAERAEAEVASLGMPGSRARTILALARAVADGKLSLARGGDPARLAEEARAVPGIGPWTAGYLGLRVSGAPDAFPTGDVVLQRALGGLSAKATDARAERWRPFRAYATLHLWTEAKGGTGA